MKTFKLLPILALSSSVMAHNSFIDSFFDDYNDFWHSLQQLEQNIINYQKFNFNTKQYFDENSNKYVVEMKVDDLAKEAINIEVNNNVLTISAKNTKKDKNNNYASMFYRSLSLPQDADGDNIEAQMKDGVLKINISKIKNNSKKITIK